jgi:flavin-dependent dehydrogenase
VGADGFHSIVGEKSGLIRTWSPDRCLLAVKEVLNLPAEVINARFQLEDGLGSEQGITTYGLSALDYFSATLYTNTDSVSLAVFARLADLGRKKIKLHDQMEMLKQHRYIDNFIKGATLREYQAHLLPDGGRVDPGNLYGDGVLLCGEAGGITDTVAGMGVPNCMLSGMMAAETIADALRKKDFSRRTLKNYLKYLDTTTLLDMVHESRRASDHIAGRGLVEYSDKMAAAADIYNRNWETEVEYIEKRFFSVWAELFLRLGRYYVPGWLYWPGAALVKLAGLPARWVEKVKGIVRRHYYGWKKNIVG